MRWLAQLSWPLVILVCLTIGLAPFAPPHVVEKVQMLAHGELHRPIDWLDLLFHGAPWVVLVAKGVVTLVPWKRGA